MFKNPSYFSDITYSKRKFAVFFDEAKIQDFRDLFSSLARSKFTSQLNINLGCGRVVFYKKNCQ